MATRRGAKQRTATVQHARRDAWRKLFIAQLRINGNITRACQTAEIERSTAYRLRESDPTFLAEWNEAIEVSIDRLEEEAYRRARDGVVKGVYYKGQIVGLESEASDSLMALMLKAKRPDQFADKLFIKLKPEWAATFDEAGKSAADILEDFVQRYHKAKQEVNNGD